MAKEESFSGLMVDLHSQYRCAAFMVKSVYQSRVQYALRVTNIGKTYSEQELRSTFANTFPPINIVRP